MNSPDRKGRGFLRAIVAALIRVGHIDVLVTTGANLTHDAIEAIGGKHHHGRINGNHADREHDERLRDEEIDRIYTSQLTMNPPQTGGLSGATLDEARSWGKLEKNAQNVSVYADATVTLALVVAGALDRVTIRRRWPCG